MAKISAVIIVRNEASGIEECLSSLSWVDEIVVVDDSSTDDTAQIAKKYTKHVYAHKSVGYVEPVRNFAIEKASNEWILLLDADERIPKSLAKHITALVNTSDPSDAYSIPRKNIIFNKWIQHTGWWPDHNIRLFKKGKVTWSNIIHSKPEVQGKLIELEPKEELAITHLNYTTVAQFLEKMLRYTDVEAQEYYDSSKKVTVGTFITLPAQEFIRRFFAGKGYKDGVHGLVLSILQSVSVFLVVVKVWEKQGFEPKEETNILGAVQKEGTGMYKEFMYWFANELLKTEKNAIRKAKLKLIRKRSQK